MSDDLLLDEIQPEQVTCADQWRILPWTGDMPAKKKKIAMRLNSIGDPYFHAKITLGYNRMVGHLHGYWLKRLSDPGLHAVFEAPRDHFKTTTGTISLSSWWALPFGPKEEDWMCQLGYGPEWIRYMKRIHDQEIKIAISNETEPNAVLMGFRFDHHYQKNAIFREVFDDLIPNTGDTWNQLVKTQNRASGQGEGTFNMLGAGTVLQSRHFNRAIHDDLVGEDAYYSDTVMQRTIEWFQKFPGAFDTDMLAPGQVNLELVTGNRWGLKDLNQHIRDNDPSFTFESHSAEGGCCAIHPIGQPIFPEEFSMERLGQLRIRFGIRNYSAHFLNCPISEEECTFRKQWIPRFRLMTKEMGTQTDGTPIHKTIIERNAKNGQVFEDIMLSELDRYLIFDPNHGGEKGRTRHAAIVVGVKRIGKRKHVFLLEAWAKNVSHQTMIGEVGEMAMRWRVQKFFVEVIAGQDGWMYYFQASMREKMPQMVVEPLKKERGAGAKDRRITSMSAVYEGQEFHVRSTGGGADEWMKEYELYPNGKTVDLIDCAGYLFNIIEGPEVDMNGWRMRQERDAQMRARSVGRAGY